MKTSNETKAKVFAQYLGCLYIRDENDKDSLKRTVDGSIILKVGEGISDWENAKLILKPLSSITNEHIIWVHDTVHNFHEQRKLRPDWAKTVTPPLNEMKDMISNGLAHYAGGYLSDSAVHQYLISKGYDVPLMLLGWKTLEQSGLAIYEK